MSAILTGPQLAQAAMNMVSNFDPTRLPRTDLTAALCAFLEPLTTEHLKREHVDKLIEAANSWFQADQLAYDDPMEGKPHAWAKHADESRRRVRIIAEAIVDGGRPE
ncbi:hypothetical protein [Micrococcus sp. TA1]|uniref:hypothetical protein n=1 Tax=Micrococcus sp. TA1 TaxID=681627 RepID=UPI00161662B8|nr:hypothetical protein [Micrococcus sp. TA1]MBB5748561.1 hypothetical protein [Micrococcus sp. TA1]